MKNSAPVGGSGRTRLTRAKSPQGRSVVPGCLPCCRERDFHCIESGYNFAIHAGAREPCPIVNRIADLHPEITAWRRDIHAHPELLYDVHRTAASVADKLKAFGCDEVVPGIGRTGVVGVIRGQQAGLRRPGMAVIGLRADMDALPIEEATGLPYKSTVQGKMHACGHDGHTAMLLGAASYLAETRNFGRHGGRDLPAGRGGRRRRPGDGQGRADGPLRHRGSLRHAQLPRHAGRRVRACGPGPLMAAADNVSIEIEGEGGHAARPHLGIDPVLVGAQIINQLQSIVSRNVDPLASGGDLDLRVPGRHDRQRHSADGASCAAPRAACTDEVRDLLESACARSPRDGAKLPWREARSSPISRDYPVTRESRAARPRLRPSVASDVAGTDRVDADLPPVMGAEDFSFMLRRGRALSSSSATATAPACITRPTTSMTTIIPVGTSYWVKLVEAALPA